VGLILSAKAAAALIHYLDYSGSKNYCLTAIQIIINKDDAL